MSFTVISGHPLLVTHHKKYREWVATHPNHMITDSIEDIPVQEGQLFSQPQPMIFQLQSVKAGQLREIFYHHKDTDIPMMVTSESPIRGGFDKDGITINHANYPKSIRERAGVIGDIFNLPEGYSMAIAKRINDPAQAFAIASQVQLSGKRRVSWSQLYIPQEKDNPPWGITDAIISGDVQRSIEETKIILRKKNSTPIGLYMQLTGYFSKIVRREGRFFSSKKMQPKDVHGMVSDMKDYSDIVLQGGKAHYGVCAYVSSLASRYQP